MSNVQQEIRFTHRTKRCPLLVIKTVLHLRRYYLPRDEDRLLVVVPRSSLHSKLFSTDRQKDYRFGEKVGNILEKWRIPDEYEERLEPEEVATIVETGDQFFLERDQPGDCHESRSLYMRRRCLRLLLQNFTRHFETEGVCGCDIRSGWI